MGSKPQCRSSCRFGHHTVWVKLLVGEEGMAWFLCVPIAFFWVISRFNQTDPLKIWHRSLKSWATRLSHGIPGNILWFPSRGPVCYELGISEVVFPIHWDGIRNCQRQGWVTCRKNIKNGLVKTLDMSSPHWPMIFLWLWPPKMNVVVSSKWMFWAWLNWTELVWTWTELNPFELNWAESFWVRCTCGLDHQHHCHPSVFVSIWLDGCMYPLRFAHPVAYPVMLLMIFHLQV